MIPVPVPNNCTGTEYCFVGWKSIKEISKERCNFFIVAFADEAPSIIPLQKGKDFILCKVTHCNSARYLLVSLTHPVCFTVHK
jgi:hypothetical protein